MSGDEIVLSNQPMAKRVSGVPHRGAELAVLEGPDGPPLKLYRFEAHQGCEPDR